MNTRLLTPDGFPRADLDVAQSELLYFRFLIYLLIDSKYEPQGHASSTSKTTTKHL